MLFSQRKGIKPVRDMIQKDSMDQDLRCGLWNALYVCIWKEGDHYYMHTSFEESKLYMLFLSYWHSFFKMPLDVMPRDFDGVIEKLKDYYFKCEWNEVYDFFEFTASNCPEELKGGFIDVSNRVLEKEKSAYRFLNAMLTDITSEEEIESIESALKDTSKYVGVHKHLTTSLNFLSNRKNPDYRKSVKESICAVESLCQVITGNPKATLGLALNKMEKTYNLHPALKKALSNLYGYTNDEGGIRHAMLEESKITSIDARFMLVSCSSFVNYILGKLSERR